MADYFENKRSHCKICIKQMMLVKVLGYIYTYLAKNIKPRWGPSSQVITFLRQGAGFHCLAPEAFPQRGSAKRGLNNFSTVLLRNSS